MASVSRALGLLIAGLLVLSSSASAAPVFSKTVDDHLGQVDDRLQDANETYGNRTEFQQARGSLQRASLSLVANASVIAQDSLMKAVAGLETGVTRAEQGESSQNLVDRGRELATGARSEVQEVRSDLDTMESSGLEPAAFAGGLAAAHAANRAMDGLATYEKALNEWERGKERPEVARAIIFHAASAELSARIASDTLERVAQERANVSSTNVLSSDELGAIADDRAAWVEGNASAIAKRSQDRVLQLHDQDEGLMTLSAFAIHYQNVAYNGLRKSMQQGGDVDTFQIARDLYNSSEPRIKAWTELLDISGDLMIGATQSAKVTVVTHERGSSGQRDNAGAFAVGLGHLGIEYTAFLQEAYGDEPHTPGNHLVSAHLASASSDERSTPSPGALLAVTFLAFAALRARRETR